MAFRSSQNPHSGTFRWPAPVASVVTLVKAMTMCGTHDFQLDDMCAAHIMMADVEETRDQI